MTPVEYKIDLPASEATVLCLSAKTLGVGSNGCGPRPLEKYIVWSEAGQVLLRLAPVAGRTEANARNLAGFRRRRASTRHWHNDGPHLSGQSHE